MATLDPTARKANVKDSLKKYFVDGLYTTKGIVVSFDVSLSVPKLQGTEVDRWVMVEIGPMLPGSLSQVDVRFYCCTRQDNEGFKLAQVRDHLLDLLIDTDVSDSRRRVPFYRSYENQAWELLGALVPTRISEGGEGKTADLTKFCIVNVTFKWGAKS